MSGKEDEMIRRMAQQAQRQQQGVTVAAPLNDVQFLSILTAITYGLNPAEGLDKAQAMAVAISARSAVVVRTGMLVKAMNQALEAVQQQDQKPTLVDN